MTGYFDPSVSHYRFGAFPFCKKRKVYFSFHYNDITRVNEVHRRLQIGRLDEPSMRGGTLWEESHLEIGEPLKSVVREAVLHVSAVCVLVGTETWARRRVRYEIARAIVEKRGLLGVHLNNIDLDSSQLPDRLGDNPFNYLGVGKKKDPSGTHYFLFEKTPNGWTRYLDFSDPVSLPLYLPEPSPGDIVALSAGLSLFDFVRDEGRKHLNSWIDHAALTVSH